MPDVQDPQTQQVILLQGQKLSSQLLQFGISGLGETQYLHDWCAITIVISDADANRGTVTNRLVSKKDPRQRDLPLPIDAQNIARNGLGLDLDDCSPSPAAFIWDRVNGLLCARRLLFKSQGLFFSRTDIDLARDRSTRLICWPTLTKP